mgnify:CR=1 FL=1
MLKKEENCYKFTTAIDNKDYCMFDCGRVDTKCKGNIELCTEEYENAKRHI